MSGKSDNRALPGNPPEILLMYFLFLWLFKQSVKRCFPNYKMIIYYTVEM
jgi:hypothetical protein